jgi:DNA-binding response OmpR family regulator
MGKATTKILVVDDDINLVSLWSELLEDEGYEVEAVYNGNAALSSASVDGIDLVLLDIMLPDIDGISVCQILRNNPETKDLPIILMSASDALREKGRNCADATLAKPFDLARLLLLIDNLI